MNKNTLEELRNKLEKEKERLEKELLSFANKDKKIEGDWDTRYPKFEASEGTLEEAADEVEEYSNLLPVEHLLELKLVDVNNAIKKIEKGKYGLCEKCGKEIKEERLKISPEAKNCLQCS